MFNSLIPTDHFYFMYNWYFNALIQHAAVIKFKNVLEDEKIYAIIDFIVTPNTMKYKTTGSNIRFEKFISESIQISELSVMQLKPNSHPNPNQILPTPFCFHSNSKFCKEIKYNLGSLNNLF